MKIRYKLVLFFLLIILPLISIPFFLYSTLNQSFQTTDYIVNHSIPLQNNSHQLESVYDTVQSDFQKYLHAGGEKSFRDFTSSEAEFNRLLDQQIQLLKSETIDRQKFITIQKAHNDWYYNTAQPAFLSRFKGTNTETYISQVTQNTEWTSNIIHRQFSLFNLEQQNQSVSKKISTENLSSSVQRILIITLAVFIAGFAVFMLFVMKIYIDPLNTFIEVTHAILRGDMKRRVAVQSPDEIGELKITFNKMLDMVEQSQTHLEERVRERTHQLVENTKVLQREKAKDEALLANIGEGIIATDTKGIIQFVNRATHEILGFGTREMVGHPLNDRVILEDELGKQLTADEHLIHQTVSSGKKLITTINTPYYWKRRDGTRFPVAITVTPVKSETGIIGAIIIFRDFTKEKEVDKAKNEFVSLASHQLRTPLSIINWYSEMLKAGDAGDFTSKQQQYINEIYHANERMVELVNALLSVSRLDLGTFVLEPIDLDIRHIADKALSEVKNIVVEKKLNIKTSYQSDIPVIHMDQKILMIIFQNLITNAVKYTPENGTIELDISYLKPPKAHIQIRVSDTGYGIPQSQQDKIFTKLFRAENVRVRDTEGTGLGLYLVKAVMHKIKGKVWFESQENKGTTFFVSFPLEHKIS